MISYTTTIDHIKLIYPYSRSGFYPHQPLPGYPPSSHFGIPGGTASSSTHGEVLLDATGSVLNSNGKHPQPSQPGKRAKKKHAGAAAARTGGPTLSALDHPLVGSSTPPHTVTPSPSPSDVFGSASSGPMRHFKGLPAVKSRKASTEVDASDVWFHIIALDDPQRPAIPPVDQPPMRGHPAKKYTHVACRLCL